MTISAKIIQDSISNGTRIITFELEYPRFCHSEFMTHRLFSRNAASSRAIPIQAMNDTIKKNPATPVHWGKNQPGMQAKEELESSAKMLVENEWYAALNNAVDSSTKMFEYGAHKQIANRVTEPFQYIKVVVTATEYDNWFWLRDHEDAQPEIRALAKQMKHVMDKSVPFAIKPGEWHVPYVDRVRSCENLEYIVDDTPVTIDTAIKISASCCAQVSYRKNDTSVEKALKIYNMLIESEPMHASPIEHQATPIGEIKNNMLPIGVTHIHRDGSFWSGNFKKWIQYRQIVQQEN